MSLFEIKNLKFRYDKFDKNAPYALNGVTFNIDKNDFVALIGKSGSGKSTLINHLNGLLKADDGLILFDGKNIYDDDFDLAKLRFKCGVVFQYPEYQLFSETVLDDVKFGALKKGLSEDEAKDKALEILRYFKIEHLKDEIPFNLSGGEKRKVAFAGIFVMEPDVFIFDEPDAGLDSLAKKDFYDMLIDLNKNHDKTIIFTTHNLDDVLEYSNKVIVIDKGTIKDVGVPFDVLDNIELMNECNLISPYAIDIYNYLKNKGVTIDKSKLHFNDLENELRRVLL